MKTANWMGSASCCAVLGAVLACSSAEEPEDHSNFLDQNRDGVLDGLGGPIDTNMDGVFNQYDFIDVNNDGVLDGLPIDTDLNGQPNGVGLDTDGDGVIDAVDTNGDKIPDIIGEPPATGGASGAGGSGGGNGSGGLGSGGLATGGANGSGGVPGSGGAPGSGAGPGSGGMPNTTCTITAEATPAMLMPTVGNVTISSDLPGATQATVQFGLDTSYGMSAPAEGGGGSFTATMFGMKPNETYHYKVVVSDGAQSCESPDQTIMTGGLRQGVARPSSAMKMAGAAPGFIITTSASSALIMDKDGDVVWGYTKSGGGGGIDAGLFDAELSWDGKYMYFRDLGPFNYNGQQNNIWRVSIDGATEELLPLERGHHHDLTVTPDGIAYIAKAAAGECDQIYLAAHDGSGAAPLVNTELIFDSYTDHGGSLMGETCHVNAIRYYEDRGVFTVSDREKDAIGVFDTNGNAVMAVGQQPNGNPSFDALVAAEAMGTSQSKWRVQHGHDFYAADKLLVFSNGAFGGGGSRVLHYTLSGSSVTLDWEYTGAGNSSTQGDVEYIPGGNVLITASEDGRIQEIVPPNQVVAEYKFPRLGYTSHRTNLYAPPD